MASFEQKLGHLRHDLRTPAGHVIGYAEMLAEDLEDEGAPALVVALNGVRGIGLQLIETIEEHFGAGKKCLADLDRQSAGREIRDHAETVRTRVGSIEESCGEEHRKSMQADLEKILVATRDIDEALTKGLAELEAKDDRPPASAETAESPFSGATPEVAEIAI